MVNSGAPHEWRHVPACSHGVKPCFGRLLTRLCERLPYVAMSRNLLNG